MAKGEPVTLPQKREIARRYAAGDSQGRISEEMQLCRVVIRREIESPEMQAQVAKLLDDIDREFVKSMVYAPFAIVLGGGKVRRKARRNPDTRRPRPPHSNQE